MLANRTRGTALACRLLLLCALFCAVVSSAVATLPLVMACRRYMAISLALIALRDPALWVVCFREL
jgi:hypothetical protein